MTGSLFVNNFKAITFLCSRWDNFHPCIHFEASNYLCRPASPAFSLSLPESRRSPLRPGRPLRNSNLPAENLMSCPKSWPY